MIGYCPIDEDPIERPRPSREVSVPVQEKRKNSTGVVPTVPTLTFEIKKCFT